MHERENECFISKDNQCTHVIWLFNFIASFTFQPIPSLEINDLQVSLDKFLISDRF